MDQKTDDTSALRSDSEAYCQFQVVGAEEIADS
jgi:hypothetical protein